MICSKTKINSDSEIEFIKKFLCENGYPLDVVQCKIHAKITQYHKPKFLVPNKCPIYLVTMN